MDVSRYVTESAAFTRATLAGKPSRWLIFILLGLPWTALSTLLENGRILEGNTIHWKLIPWQEAGLLIATGVCCNLLVAGWIVRLLRDDPVPPDFDRPALLILEGMKVQVIPLVWMLVPAVLAFIQYALVGGSTFTLTLWPPDAESLPILVLLALQLLILFFAVQYGMVGAIRFSRTGSMAAAFDLRAVKRTMDRVGIINYYLCIGVVAVSGILLSLALRLAGLVPLAGPALALFLSPVPAVFCFRFIAHYLDEERLSGEREGSGMNAPGSGEAGRLLREFVAWGVILGALVILCFTPMILIVGRLSRLLP